jgi:hypothetical protein
LGSRRAGDFNDRSSVVGQIASSIIEATHFVFSGKAIHFLLHIEPQVISALNWLHIDGHWNQRGSDLFAEAIAGYLEHRLADPVRPTPPARRLVAEITRQRFVLNGLRQVGAARIVSARRSDV